MTQLDEIKARIAAFEALTIRHFSGGELEVEHPTAANFWNNVEADLRWCIDELEKYTECEDSNGCLYNGSPHRIQPRIVTLRTVYHREGE